MFTSIQYDLNDVKVIQLKTFSEQLLCVRQCAKCFPFITSFNPHINTCNTYYYYLNFTDEEMEAKKGNVAYPRTYS